MFGISTKSDDIRKPLTKSGTNDEDLEKLREIALETKSPNRQKLGTGNIHVLRGIVMSNEKENSNKRKRQSDELDRKGKIQ